MSSGETMLNLNKLHFPVTTLGPGNRIGIWFQGCSIRCPGCISMDTWEFSREGRVDLASVFEVIESWLPQADGLTISGGEPFDQSEALAELLARFDNAEGDRDVLVFSGYEFSFLREKHEELLTRIDALVSGPFVASAGQSAGLRGSDNQELHLLSDRGRRLFSQEPSPSRTLDVFEDRDGIWFAGIPRADEWESLPERLAGDGITGNFSQHER